MFYMLMASLTVLWVHMHDVVISSSPRQKTKLWRTSALGRYAWQQCNTSLELTTRRNVVQPVTGRNCEESLRTQYSTVLCSKTFLTVSIDHLWSTLVSAYLSWESSTNVDGISGKQTGLNILPQLSVLFLWFQWTAYQ